MCKNVCKESSIDINDISSIGIAVPGGVDEKTGVICFTPNIPFTGLNIINFLSKKFTGKRIKVINDANAALVAERKFGSIKKHKNVVMITLGTGIGGAVLLNNKIITGINGMAGELGHMVIHKNGIKCSCGRKGCFEVYASASALVKNTNKELKKYNKDISSSLINKININAKDIFDAYKNGDLLAKKMIYKYVKDLSNGITSLINIFQPEVFLIGGGISEQQETLINLIRPHVDKSVYSHSVMIQTKLLTASCGNDAGIIGAAFA